MQAELICCFSDKLQHTTPTKFKLNCVSTGYENSSIYCKFGNIREDFIFAKLMRSFVKIRSSRNGEITLSFTDEGKSCHSRDFLRRKYVF